MNLDPTDEETAALLRELDGIIDGDRYFLLFLLELAKKMFYPPSPRVTVVRSASEMQEVTGELPKCWENPTAYDPHRIPAFRLLSAKELRPFLNYN